MFDVYPGTLHHHSAVAGLLDSRECRAETGSHLLSNGECLAVILVSTAYVITLIGRLQFILAHGCINGNPCFLANLDEFHV